MKRYLKVIKQELKPGYIVQTLENGETRNINYLIDSDGNEYVETNPDLIKVEVQ